MYNIHCILKRRKVGYVNNVVEYDCVLLETSEQNICRNAVGCALDTDDQIIENKYDVINCNSTQKLIRILGNDFAILAIGE